MIILLVIFIILVVVFAKVYINISKKDIENVLSKKQLDGYTSNMPDNIQMCNQILADLDVNNVNVKLSEDKKTTTSFYNVFSKQIILCDNPSANKSFARVLYIAHECIHASQKQIQLKLNFILANINLFFCLAVIVLLWCNVIQESMYLPILGIVLILNMFSFFARNAIESSAVYMSIIKARNYLEKYIELQKVEMIEKEYETIIHKGYTTFVFNLFTTNIALIFLVILSMLFCTYIY